MSPASAPPSRLGGLQGGAKFGGQNIGWPWREVTMEAGMQPCQAAVTSGGGKDRQVSQWNPSIRGPAQRAPFS